MPDLPGRAIPAPNSWITLAHLLRPQGRKGELLADLFTDFPDSLPGRQLFLQLPNAEPRPIEVLSQWLPVGRNAGRIVLQLAGIDSISAAEALAGADLVVPAQDRVPLTDGSVYISDLIGCTLLDRGHPVGLIEAVDLPTTPDGLTPLPDAAPILTLRTPANDEVLIPFVQAWLTRLDTPNKQIEMALPEGLLDINRPTGSG